MCVHSVTAQLCPTLCSPMDCYPPGSFSLWDYPGKNTGVGCHFLFQLFCILLHILLHICCYILYYNTIYHYIIYNIFKLDLEKAEEPEIKLPTSAESSKKQESFRKTFTSALLTMTKPVWITINCGKF